MKNKIDKLSDVRRIPRLGKIHLGVKRVSDKSGKEYPAAVDYFVFEDNPMGEKCKSAYGAAPKELIILLPSKEQTETFPQNYKSYRSGVGVWCRGDGKEATRKGDDGAESTVMCRGRGDKKEGAEPCEHYENKKCKQMGNFLFMLPKVAAGGGCFQIDTSSINSIIDINSGIESVSEFAESHGVSVREVPALLRMVSRKATVNGKSAIIHSMVLTVAPFASWKEILDDINAIKRELGGLSEPRLALPEVQQSVFEETDLIPSSVQTHEGLDLAVKEEVVVADIIDVEAVTPPTKLSVIAPDTVTSPRVKAAWPIIMTMANDRGWSWARLIEHITISLNLASEPKDLAAELSVKQWEKLYKLMSKEVGK